MGLFDYLIATDDGRSAMHRNDSGNGEEAKEEGDETTTEKSSSKKLKKRITDAEFGVVRGVDFKNVRTVRNCTIPIQVKKCHLGCSLASFHDTFCDET